jgi:ketol-acid reductoisomerase
MVNKLDDPSRLKVHELSNELKKIMTPLFKTHMNDILSGDFSKNMMSDWDNNDNNLLKWREETGNTNFEKTDPSNVQIPNDDYFKKGILMIAFVKSGVELAFETMVNNGIIDESAYYESLHELPLIANLVARKKLYEMNKIISDTAEYGCYLFNQSCLPLLSEFMKKIDKTHIGIVNNDTEIDKIKLNKFDSDTENHPIEKIGMILRQNMSNMKKLNK